MQGRSSRVRLRGGLTRGLHRQGWDGKPDLSHAAPERFAQRDEAWESSSHRFPAEGEGWGTHYSMTWNEYSLPAEAAAFRSATAPGGKNPYSPFSRLAHSVTA